MITRVDLPLSRGSVLSGNAQVCCWLRLTLASHFAVCRGFERTRPFLLRAEVAAREPFRGLPAAAAALDVARRLAGEALRLQRGAAGIIARPALENLHEGVGVVRRL